MGQTKLVLQNFRNKELIEGLSWIYDQAISGKISGACFIIMHNRFKHSVGVIGDYRADPYSAIRAIKKLEATVHNYAEELEEHAEVEIQY